MRGCTIATIRASNRAQSALRAILDAFNHPSKVSVSALSRLLQQGRLNRINARTPRPLTNNDRSAEKLSRTITKGGRKGEPHSTGWMVRRSLDPRDLATSCSIAFKSTKTSFAARIEAQDHLYAVVRSSDSALTCVRRRRIGQWK